MRFSNAAIFCCRTNRDPTSVMGPPMPFVRVTDTTPEIKSVHVRDRPNSGANLLDLYAACYRYVGFALAWAGNRWPPLDSSHTSPGYQLGQASALLTYKKTRFMSPLTRAVASLRMRDAFSRPTRTGLQALLLLWALRWSVDWQCSIA